MSKRGNNEGTITKRSDGRYVAAASVGDGRRKWVYGRTREEVARKLNDLLYQHAKGLPPSDDRITVSQLLDRWLEATESKVRDSTQERREQMIRLHIKPGLGRVRLSALTPMQIESFMRARLAEGQSPATVKGYRDTLRAAINVAMRWQLVHRNVAALAGAPRQARKQVQVMTPEQIDVLMSALPDARQGHLYTVALATGLRRGELLGLEWSDIDFEGRTLRVRQALQRSRRRLGLTEVKTERSRRTIPLTAVALQALRDRRVVQLEDQLAAGQRWRSSNLVFTTTYGTPFEPSNIRRDFKHVLRLAGLPDAIRLHDLRHAHITLLLMMGVKPRVVMELAGHSQIGVTMNTYGHVIPTQEAEAARLLDSFFQARRQKA